MTCASGGGRSRADWEFTLGGLDTSVAAFLIRSTGV